MRWTLHRYYGFPRIVSTRIAMIPDMPNSAIYQVIVKIRSLQSLERLRKRRGGKDDTLIEAPGNKPKQKAEYLVLQRMMLKGKEQPWMIWGTTEETEVEDVVKDQSRRSSTT